ncbi:hypothetical protein RE428_48610 (plasmid) [Marinobacter nanhaiticus D15-8W]|uniref:Uncharacterized protein n=1 Tax=Marinobacter nanhaiticus D15-8W TaxID=626887 RepID=N6WZY5_9GAMM|nr:hypothetical protein [Marinobacter nanhaiticus]ENO17116.1 hypothetical protein J057_00584 [Marinobacter nanhaiticus D15-8W]BES73843.1 hypothetical protein RE428_48610 [Marinobacter nanhaiticus D15-8W]
MTKQKKLALSYTIAMVTGLAVGAHFNPVVSIFGGFAGLYVVALATGKIAFKPSGAPHKTGNSLIDAHHEMEDLVDGDGLPGSGQDLRS